MPDDEKRVPLSLKVRPSLKTYITAVADKEDRNENNVAEMLLSWAAIQLRVAGDTLTLKSWVAQPSSGEYFVTDEGHLGFRTVDGKESIFDIPSAAMRRAIDLRTEHTSHSGKKK